MKQYLDALKYILDNGEAVSDRTGVGTRSIFGYQMRFNLQDGFPAVTTKRLAWRAVVGELLWFLEGSTDERRLAEITYGKHRSEISDRNTIWTATFMRCLLLRLRALSAVLDLKYILSHCLRLNIDSTMMFYSICVP